MSTIQFEKIPLLGPDSADDSSDVNAQLTQNLWPRMRVPGSRNVLAMYNTPGLTKIATAPSGGPTRGKGVRFNGYAYLVVKNKLIQIDSFNAVTEVGTLNTSSGRIVMQAGRSYILIVDGTNGYTYDGTNFVTCGLFSSGTTTGTTANKLVDSGANFVADGVQVGAIVFNTTDSTSATVTAVDSATQLSVDSDVFPTGKAYEVGDQDFPDTATHAAYLGGYFILNQPNTDYFWITANEDPRSVNALDFESAAEKPDDVYGVAATTRDLLVFGDESTQVYYNSGDPSFPFTLYQGGVLEFGVEAKYSISESSQGIFLLARAREGGIFVVHMSGMQFAVISNDIADDLKDYATTNDAYGSVYRYSDKTYYQLTFPTEGVTHEYILEDKFWVRRKSYGIGYHLTAGQVYYNNLNIVGDYNTGEIYKIDGTVYTEDGDAVERIRRTQQIHRGKNGLVFHEVVLLLEAGVGTVSGAGLAPQVAMRYSDDGGHNWSSWMNGEMGALGETTVECYWTKLGKSPRGRIFDFKVTDPVKTVFIDAYARITVTK